MKALYFEEHGELDVIQYGDVPEPETGPGQIKIRVRATALNYLDIWMRRGWPGLKLEMPHWCGADIAASGLSPIRVLIYLKMNIPGGVKIV
jgi:alcohol dehydrogenase